ncbi:hypothetical protein OSB04_001509 [Centaurea solstitialis]|uniref:Dilute domain-containing protein n=1 Tax=Centaurea solstitialis TaxID=347529 RepID=A0AA38TR43_9ASTR|nr:hypothetical protein OSB04_001509 [Centaurea solstitialis]
MTRGDTSTNRPIGRLLRANQPPLSLIPVKRSKVVRLPVNGDWLSLKSKIKELESENELLRNQKMIVEQITTPEKVLLQVQSLDNGHETKDSFETPHVEQEKTKESDNTGSFLTKQKSLTDRQQENHDVLIKCLMEDKRFDKTRPVAACIVYKTLVQWRSFEAEKTHIFDRIIHTIRSSIETQDNNIKDLAYWLSTTSTLLFLLQSTIKASGSPYKSPHRNRASPTTLFGRMTQGFRASPISSGYSGMEGKPSAQSKIEAKYPALLFKQHLTACVEKLYGMIRDSLKKEISPFLNSCIQAPRSTRVRSTRGASRNILSNIVAKQQASSIHWQSIVKSLDNTLEILSKNYVPPIITRKIFSQVFSFIDVQFFNSLLLRRECCSFSNGEYVKSGLHELEQWCKKATDQVIIVRPKHLYMNLRKNLCMWQDKNSLHFSGSSWDDLQHIRQAVGLLVSHQKTQKSMEEITNELCPVLSVPQIYRIGTMFWDDKYGTQGLSQEGLLHGNVFNLSRKVIVIGKMRSLMAEDSISMPNNSFLLDVDSSIPFSLEEISQSFLDIDLSDIDPPPLLRQRSDFHFLLQQID